MTQWDPLPVTAAVAGPLVHGAQPVPCAVDGAPVTQASLPPRPSTAHAVPGAQLTRTSVPLRPSTATPPAAPSLGQASKPGGTADGVVVVVRILQLHQLWADGVDVAHVMTLYEDCLSARAEALGVAVHACDCGCMPA